MARAKLEGYSKRQELHILLVDDDLDMRILVGALIRQLWKDVELDLAANGREALQKLNVGSYHVLLTDLQMPTMDGYDTAQAVRSLPPPACHIKIICMTGGDISEERARQSGIDGHILKPFTIDDLRLKISEVVARPLWPSDDY